MSMRGEKFVGHVLVIPKFGRAQYILKGRSALDSNDHPIKTNTNTVINGRKTVFLAGEKPLQPGKLCMFIQNIFPENANKNKII